MHIDFQLKQITSKLPPIPKKYMIHLTYFIEVKDINQFISRFTYLFIYISLQYMINL